MFSGLGKREWISAAEGKTQFFPGFSLPTQVSHKEPVLALWLSRAFSCAFSSVTSVPAESVNCRNTFGMCMKDSRDGCVTDPYCGHRGFFKALGSAIM